jgi:hypothetical protein
MCNQNGWDFNDVRIGQVEGGRYLAGSGANSPADSSL